MALSLIGNSNTSSFEYVTSSSSIQLYYNYNSSEQEKKDIKNNIINIDISSCQNKIRKKYNISSPLQIAKVGYSEALNNAYTYLDSTNPNLVSSGSSVNFRVFNPDTKNEYDLLKNVTQYL